MTTPSIADQAKAVLHIKERFDHCEKKLANRHEEFIDIYEAFYKMKEDDPFMTFKINKANEIVEKVVPDYSARDPRWIVSVRDVSAFAVPKAVKDIQQELSGKVLTKEQKLKVAAKIRELKMARATEEAEAIQNYLTYIFDEYSLIEIVELWAKNSAVYGKAHAEIDYEYESAYVPGEEDEVVMDPTTGEAMLKDDGSEQTQKVTRPRQKISGEHPTIKLVEWPDIYYDPKYIFFKDRPYHIQVKEGVREADVMRAQKREKYFNLDKLTEMIKAYKDLGKAGAQNSSFKQKMQEITGTTVDTVKPFTDKDLTLRIYYGKYNLKPDDPKGEKLYKITTVCDLLVIGMEEICYIPMEEINCFPDTNSAFSKGFVEPILGLQEEMNFKKNAAAEYINTKLRKRFIWSEKSGIDPRDINKQIIVAHDGVPKAKLEFEELELSEIAGSYFNEQNDLERQIQSASFTIDTSNPRTQNALTATATGARIKFYESSAVREGVRKRFERGLSRLAYKLLLCSFDNMEDNIVMKKMGAEGYFEMNKEALRDAVTKYSIKIETNSSSFTALEDRRDDAVAWFNLCKELDAKLAEQQSPRRVDFIKVFEDIGATFEKRDTQKYLTAPNPTALAQQLMPQQPTAPGAPAASPAPMQSGAKELTEKIAGKL